jgi:hypothetical protein
MEGVVIEKISVQIISLCARLAVIFKHITASHQRYPASISSFLSSQR